MTTNLNTAAAARAEYRTWATEQLGAEQLRLQDVADTTSRPQTRAMAQRNLDLISAEINRRWFALTPNQRQAKMRG
ncbi:hypothetical protein CCR97_08205 [Rhodoplanes elegans]|uniref:Uncharacterized protein n=1 Tax=Rhodoplanes elegans TaxID=29408 RepID=A0A327KV70_9BRAD|nr:hypothetical protein [Rhodoplanes elegans]MBK5958101.1 hypothetical protein [Rhodoplanes elegans]MBK5958193.1 hypothetical protein [Rhodoplanes elegans]RAI41976.1 hypothetical protein CH338_01345 [Rhodoplanes elegans]